MRLLDHHELSKKKARPVTSFADIKEDAYAMLDLLDKGIIHKDHRLGAVALSHAQVSKEPFTFFVVDRAYKQFFGGRRIIINAKVTDQKDIVSFEEGCLSFPDRPHWQTKRFRQIDVEWNFPAVNGEIHWRTNKEHHDGLVAMIYQHELDHAAGETIYSKFLEENRAPKK